MKTVKKYLKSTLLSVVLTTALLTVLHIAMEGMFLLGTPKKAEVVKVQIAYPEVTTECKEFTDDGNIELACNLLNVLSYVPFQQADAGEEPLITMTYWNEDGTSKTVSANRETVWWSGKTHVLKDDDTFVNLTEGVFFLKDMAQE